MPPPPSSSAAPKSHVVWPFPHPVLFKCYTLISYKKKGGVRGASQPLRMCSAEAPVAVGSDGSVPGGGSTTLKDVSRKDRMQRMDQRRMRCVALLKILVCVREKERTKKTSKHTYMAHPVEFIRYFLVVGVVFALLSFCVLVGAYLPRVLCFHAVVKLCSVAFLSFL